MSVFINTNRSILGEVQPYSHHSLQKSLARLLDGVTLQVPLEEQSGSKGLSDPLQFRRREAQ